MHAQEAISRGYGFGISPITGEIEEMAVCLEEKRELELTAAQTAHDNKESRS